MSAIGGFDDEGPRRAHDTLVRAVRTALARLDDPVSLRSHPLATWATPGQGATSPLARASLLRRRLLEGIELLRPPPGTPPNAPAWRSYRLLSLRYAERRDAPSVQRDLGLAKSQYYVEHARALERLADLFAERWLDPKPASGRPPGHVERDDASEPATRAPMPEPGSRLPSPLTSFIGREREVTVVRSWLTRRGAPGSPACGSRLVTITGAAGAGKTRLSVRVAAGLRDEYGERVFFVALAALRDPDLVLPAICRALGVPDGGGSPLLARLQSLLGDEDTLVVLDNFEQVLEAGPAIAEMLAACPRLSVLATSRAPLGVYGEREFPLSPLPPPSRGADQRIEEARANPAMRLFVDRARAVRPDFSLDDGNLGAVAEICRRLDGLPLAIELAAARIKMLSPAGLVERLDSRLGLLSSGPRDLPERQRSLRGALSWSYHLLRGSEQTLFRELSVFASSWTLDAAREVASGESPLATLTALVNQSLVVREEDEGTSPRFSMLETIREYARELLDEHGETGVTRARHAAYFARRVVEAEPHLLGPEQVAWVARLEREHENVQAALGWCLETGHIERGLWLAATLAVVWRLRGEFTEGRRWLDELLRARPCERTAAREAAALWAGILAVYQCDWPHALAWYEESLAIARELGDRLGIARALTSLGYVGYFRGDEAAAERYAREALPIYDDLGDLQHSTNTLDLAGHVEAARGDRRAARAHYARALAIRHAAGDVAGAGWSYHQLGALALDQGNTAAARPLLARSLDIRRRVGDEGGAILTLQTCARLAVAESRPRLALQLAGAAAARAAAFGMLIRPADEEKLEASLDAARRALGDDEACAAWADGRAMTLGEAIDSATS